MTTSMDQFSEIFFSNSFTMRRLRIVIREIAKTDMTVLIKGESGSGKELVAQTIHQDSGRREKPFIRVNCAAIPRTLIESELFGFEKGAFTGAHLQKPGKFELATGGTILLDEIGEMDISIQAKLLQVLQNGEFYPLGSEQSVVADARVITTTKDYLERSLFAGGFRQDLFYRINMATVTVPPLRDRRGQILALAHYFGKIYGQKYGKSFLPLSAASIKALESHLWPGNIRELENAIKRFVLFQDEALIIQGLSSPSSLNGNEGTLPEEDDPEVRGTGKINLKEIGKRAGEEAEKRLIESTLYETHWNRKEAARLLRVSYKALLYKIQKYKLDKIRISSNVEERKE